MQHSELVTLIQGGVPAGPSTWADLGAGTGNFTAALRDLLPPDAVIYAVDRDAHAIRAQQSRWQTASPGATIIPLIADLTQRLPLPPLDGILMANVLHFIRAQVAVLQPIVRMLHPGGRLLLVEYDVDAPRSYIPFPISAARFPSLAFELGLATPMIIGKRRSPSSGIVMYAGSALAISVGL